MNSRRSVLLGLAGAAAVATVPAGITLAGRAGAEETSVPPAGPETGAPAAIPETLGKKRDGLSHGSQVKDTEFPLTMLSVAAAVPVAVRFRTATGWTQWSEGAAPWRGRDDRRGRGRLFVARGAQGYEVQTKGGGEVRAVEVNTVDGPTSQAKEGARALQLSPQSAGIEDLPTYLSRAAWGADESYRFEADGSVKLQVRHRAGRAITLNHSGFDDGTDNTTDDFAALIRGIYYTDVFADDYGDIGYHLMIDGDGKVYEGRFTDGDRIPVFGAGQLRRVNKGEDPNSDDPSKPVASPPGALPPASGALYPAVIEGAHTFRYNPGNVGICLIGNFNQRQPTEAAYRSLVTVLALLAKRLDLDPTGKINYHNPDNGRSQNTYPIVGAKDWFLMDPEASDTDSPGHQFRPRLPQLREDVRSMLGTVRA